MSQPSVVCDLVTYWRLPSAFICDRWSKKKSGQRQARSERCMTGWPKSILPNMWRSIMARSWIMMRTFKLCTLACGRNTAVNRSCCVEWNQSPNAY